MERLNKTFQHFTFSVDPGDLVSEKSLHKSYKILGQVDFMKYLFDFYIFIHVGSGNRETSYQEQKGSFRRGGWRLLQIFLISRFAHLLNNAM